MSWQLYSASWEGLVMELQQPDSGLTVELRGKVAVARFTREVVLSGRAAEAATERLTALLAEPGRRQLLVDFGNVRSLSSLMLGKLVRLSRTAETAGVQLALFNVQPVVREILEVTGLHRIVSLYGSESEALQGS
jgi:anti-anti-sigma factor